jgi:hypothetical protein
MGFYRVFKILLIRRLKDRKNNNSILLQEVLESYYIHKVDKKTNVDTNVNANVDLKLLPYSHLINI